MSREEPPREEAIWEALKSFETCLETPIVAGELASWVTNAQRSCDEAVAALGEHVKTRHEKVMDEIIDEDPELSSRFEQLREQDATLLKEGRQLKADMDTLASDAELMASHDPHVKDEVHDFIESGLRWIIGVRTQEQELTTWYQESFNRDRGIAD